MAHASPARWPLRARGALACQTVARRRTHRPNPARRPSPAPADPAWHASPAHAQNAKRFRKSSWKPYKSNKGESEEDTSYIATIYVATDASGEAIESAEGAAEVAEGAAA